MMVNLMCQLEYVKARPDIWPDILDATLRVSKEDYHLNWIALSEEVDPTQSAEDPIRTPRLIL